MGSSRNTVMAAYRNSPVSYIFCERETKAIGEREERRLVCWRLKERM
jgi:hypothetical protein